MSTLGQGTYLALDLFSIAGPLAYGFTRHSQFNRKWRAILPALLGMALPFIAWDALFTAHGVWGFNSEYHLGITWFQLPMEEWLFFICIPFACLFLHDVAGHFPNWHLPEIQARWLWGMLGLIFFLLAGFHFQKAYTLSAFGLAGVLSAGLAAGGFKGFTGQFTLTFLFHCLPFFLVNGFLTSLPVVIYNDSHNLGIRIGTIPVEDLAYSLTLISGSVFIYEFLNRHFLKRK